jgi:hypothetical protein
LLLWPRYCVVITFFAVNLEWAFIRHEFINVRLPRAAANAMVFK